jgi:hypothetical protein
MAQFSAFINPMRMFEWDDDPLPTLPEHPTPERLLEFLCTPALKSEMPDFKERYRSISTGDVFVTIYEPGFNENLLWPLRHAKTSYLLGNFVGTIALCGIVAEKVAILIHALNTTDNVERESFEQLDQWRRVDQLKGKGWLTPEMIQAFGTIKGARKEYLHYWTTEQSRVAQDAVLSYTAATQLLVSAMSITFADGRIYLRPQVAAYLKSRGALRDDVEQEGGA